MKKGNSFPIIFLHGFQGWGRDELLGHKYWGGSVDLQEELRKEGVDCFTAQVGPYSSNWDRACELFAYIKGGQVDYGEAHSKRHQHQRFGKTFSGVYPEWGTVCPKTGEIRKIHLIAHSMGGQTARMLIHLLENGHNDEKKCGNDLFEGGKGWVHSLMTISSPHNGTTLTRMVNNVLPFAKELVASLAAIKGNKLANSFFDFKLDHWGLRVKKDEKFTNYVKRIAESSIWKNNKDICLYDLSPEGAKEINSWLKSSKNVFYFSWATNCAVKSPFSERQIPTLKTEPFWYPAMLYMGSHKTQNVDGLEDIDESWFPNDGVVNTISMTSPFSEKSIPISENPQKGLWNFMGELKGCDHMDIIGALKLGFHFPVEGYSEVKNWYLEQVQYLLNLPK